MIITTRHFGEIEIDEEKILFFKEGILGFEHIKKYCLINDKDQESPFKWLQSFDEPGLAFAIVDPFAIKKDYYINLDKGIADILEIEKEEDILVFSIVVIPDDISKMSMNLKAPLIINARQKTGIQMVLDTDRYNVRHYILDELREQGEDNNACTDKKEGSDDNNK